MNESGYIVVAVRTAGGAIPVENAVVTVKSENDEILYVVFTDRSGKTPSLKVAAPDKALSQVPDSSVPPYATYKIDTDIAGYIPVRDQNVPVYSGVTSIQPIELLPKTEQRA